jgi:hypothetical protein
LRPRNAKNGAPSRRRGTNTSKKPVKPERLNASAIQSFMIERGPAGMKTVRRLLDSRSAGN